MPRCCGCRRGQIQTIATDGDVRLGGLRLGPAAGRTPWPTRFQASAKDRSPRRSGGHEPARLGRGRSRPKHALECPDARRPLRLGISSGKWLEDPGHAGAIRGPFRRLARKDGLDQPAVAGLAKWQWSSVTRLLLVGGSTRMPMVGEMLRRNDRVWSPTTPYTPDEAVARGAVPYAGVPAGPPEAGSPRRRRSLRYQAMSIPTAWASKHRPGIRSGKRNVAADSRNTPLPAKVRDRFATKAENQTLHRALQALEGQSPSPGGMHGHWADGDPATCRGAPAELARRGHLRVRLERAVSRPRSGARHTPKRDASALDAPPAAPPEESIVRWKQPIIHASAGFDRFEAVLREVLQVSVPQPLDWPRHDTPPADADFGVGGGSAPNPTARRAGRRRFTGRARRGGGCRGGRRRQPGKGAWRFSSF